MASVSGLGGRDDIDLVSSHARCARVLGLLLNVVAAAGVLVLAVLLFAVLRPWTSSRVVALADYRRRV